MFDNMRSFTSTTVFSATVLSLLTAAGCFLIGDDEPVILDGPYTDYYAFANAELPPRPVISGRYIHFENTPYVLSSRIDCRTLPVDSVSTFELLQLPPEIDVQEWIRYYHADFGNEYKEIAPYRHRMLSGSVHLTEIDDQTQPRVVRYRLEAEDVVFEGRRRIPSIQTEKHTCYLGYGQE